ncbi:DUF3515 domain-containing protein [Raineyella sp. W15-4]|uniref:DUF3515 domain-containing protein n=1 Tax=Raineyella sp. W15-4 TaxID=3081651 RepID=UPI002954E50B|nr:DUF3515 domain-containing protein [Raineyella sp. W15-4]WOQ18458.1 DUF3515 domain-containing protein [Raineyella sp. W15-4]
MRDARPAALGVRPAALGVATATTILLAGCSAPVQLPDPPVDDATRALCTALVADAPATLLGSPRRATTGSLAVAWGDPPITLACGLPQPAGLTPTSQCLEVNGVGWWSQDGVTGTVFTTVGRAAYVQVGVPNSYGNTGDALAELASVVADHDTLLRPCVG